MWISLLIGGVSIILNLYCKDICVLEKHGSFVNAVQDFASFRTGVHSHGKNITEGFVVVVTISWGCFVWIYFRSHTFLA